MNPNTIPIIWVGRGREGGRWGYVGRACSSAPGARQSGRGFLGSPGPGAAWPTATRGQIVDNITKYQGRSIRPRSSPRS
jgi:hypothetical protein